MPRTEARIFTSIWRDRAYISLSVDAQWLYEFLVSQDDLTYCGVIPLRPARWKSKAADMTMGRVEAALKELEGTAYPSANPDPESIHAPFVITDEDTGELLVRSLLRRDHAWKQPNLLKLAMESAEQIESPRIRGVLLSELRRLPLSESGSEQVRTLVAQFIGDLVQGGPYPSAYPHPNPEDDPSDNPHDDPSDKNYARAQGVGGEVTVYRDPPDPLFPVPQDPSLSSRKNGTRLPEDFALTGEMCSWAAIEAPHVNVERETDRFRDYWLAKPGKDGRKLDWNRTWKNWMRTAEDRQGPRERPGQHQASAADQRRTEVARLREIDRQQREGGGPSNVIQGRAE